MKTNMTMTYELITPEVAEFFLKSNHGNRKISPVTVRAYAHDMFNGNWDENVGSPISIDEDGVLRNGQHRLQAIVESGKPIRMWVCRNVSSTGVYDDVRKRSTRDQISIIRPDIESVYMSNRYHGVVRAIINRSSTGKVTNKKATAKTILDFTDKHKEELDGFFLRIPQDTVPRISVTVVHLSLFMAYMAGVEIEKILKFYDVLVSGMSCKPEEFPIISYRNYLMDIKGNVQTTREEISRCQYALKNYLYGTCLKRTMSPKNLVWDFPWPEEVSVEKQTA